jgi:hypothetical protein
MRGLSSLTWKKEELEPPLCEPEHSKKGGKSRNQRGYICTIAKRPAIVRTYPIQYLRSRRLSVCYGQVTRCGLISDNRKRHHVRRALVSSKNFLEIRRVQCHNHQQSRHQTGTWESDDPRRENECNLPPVDSTNVQVAECDANGCAGKTLGRADRKAETTGEQDGDRSPDFRGRTTCRRDLSDFVSERAHHVVAIN